MSKLLKINFTQKEILGNFMAEHPDLAKSILPNTSQGKARANQLWERLTTKLNASGPPIKDAKMWRKVYADQKQNVKKKITFNKSSKKKTGGGPYEEKILSQVEEQILSAAGIEVSVDGLKSVQTFGSVLSTNTIEDTLQQKSDFANSTTAISHKSNFSGTSPCSLSDDEDKNMQCNTSTFLEFADDGEEATIKSSQINNVPQKINLRRKETKTALLKQNMNTTEIYHKEMLKRVDLLIEIKKKKLTLREKECEFAAQILETKNKKLEMKEMEHELNSQMKAMELQIKRKELEKLNTDF